MSCSAPHDLAFFALLTPHETQRMDSNLEPSLPQVMEHAGMMVARVVCQYIRPCRVLVACGPGNNGGDGYVAARYLAARGWSVCVAAYGTPKAGSLAGDMAKRWDGPFVPFAPEEAQRVDIVIDAVFGAGLSRALPEEVGVFLRAARRVVAIDVPSGLDGATGALRGEVAACQMTVALIRKRPGHLLGPGRAVCGEVVCADLCVPEEAWAGVSPHIWENSPVLWHVPRQKEEDHKYTRGVVNLCGGAHMPGAAFFASEAARHVGAGMVRLSVSAEAALLYRLASPAAIVDTQPLPVSLEDERRQVWVCGPGLVVDEVAHLMPHLQKAKRCIVADAGAFSWAAGDPERLRGVSVITPHAGEFARVFGEIKDSAIQAVQRVAAELNLVVVLKGADTLVAAPDGRVAINVHATPALAVAGAGDVLSGIIAAFLAAGMPAWEAAAAGVWVHGEAGRRAAGKRGGWIVPENLFDELGVARHKATYFSR